MGSLTGPNLKAFGHDAGTFESLFEVNKYWAVKQTKQPNWKIINYIHLARTVLVR
jgi:hypothetical protein